MWRVGLGTLAMATLCVLTWLCALSALSDSWYKWLWSGLPRCNLGADLDTTYFEMCQSCGYIDTIFFLILEWEFATPVFHLSSDPSGLSN